MCESESLSTTVPRIPGFALLRAKAAAAGRREEEEVTPERAHARAALQAEKRGRSPTNEGCARMLMLE